MLAIVRIEGTPFTKVCLYELRVNSKVICTFEHAYNDGLAKCLMRASFAASRAQFMQGFNDICGGLKNNDND